MYVFRMIKIKTLLAVSFQIGSVILYFSLTPLITDDYTLGINFTLNFYTVHLNEGISSVVAKLQDFRRNLTGTTEKPSVIHRKFRIDVYLRNIG